MQAGREGGQGEQTGREGQARKGERGGGESRDRGIEQFPSQLIDLRAFLLPSLPPPFHHSLF